MAKTLTTPISVTNSVANINKWMVVDYHDHTNDAVPSVEVLVQAQGGGKVYGLYWLHAWDLQNSLCLTVNTTSVSMDDQLSVAWRQLTSAYTTITSAHDGTSGNNKAKLLAVEAALLATGLVDAASFAGA